MSNPKIVGTNSSEAMFSVAFPNGFDGEPHITVNHLSIEGDGESSAYAILLACSNWLVNHVDEMKSKQQVYVRCKNGVVTEIED